MSPEQNTNAVELLASVEPFIIKYANHYGACFQMDAADLAQVGRIEAWRSAQTFDSTYGVPFMNYCALVVRVAMRREAIKMNGPVQRSEYSYFTKPTRGVAIDLRAGEKGKESDDPLLDLLVQDDVTPADHVESFIRRSAVLDAISRLKPRQRRVITERFIEGRTQREIGEGLGISYQAVAHIENRALINLSLDPAIKLLSGNMLPRIADDFKAARIPKRLLARKQPRS